MAKEVNAKITYVHPTSVFDTVAAAREQHFKDAQRNVSDAANTVEAYDEYLAFNNKTEIYALTADSKGYTVVRKWPDDETLTYALYNKLGPITGWSVDITTEEI